MPQLHSLSDLLHDLGGDQVVHWIGRVEVVEPKISIDGHAT